jgi:hypothetical protein
VTSKSETIKVGNATLKRLGDRETWAGRLGTLDFVISKESWGFEPRAKFFGRVNIVGLRGCYSLVEAQDNTLNKVVASLSKKLTAIQHDVNATLRS